MPARLGHKADLTSLGEWYATSAVAPATRGILQKAVVGYVWTRGKRGMVRVALYSGNSVPLQSPRGALITGEQVRAELEMTRGQRTVE